MKVSNKVIVVTGGGSGIGRQLVLNLVHKGARVAAVDLNFQTLQETVNLAGSYGEKISTHVVNITDQKLVEGLPDQVIKVHGSVDGLINNAGIIQPFTKVINLTYEQIEKVMNVNFYGLLYMTKSFLPHLLKRPEAHILNISSMGGFLPVPGQTIYGASKAAVMLLTEGLNSELMDTNVHVTIVYPGAIGTNISVNSGIMTSEQRVSLDTGKMKMTSAEDASEMIIKGMEQNKYRILVGGDAKLMDFLMRLNPKMAAKFIYNQMKSLLE